MPSCIPLSNYHNLSRSAGSANYQIGILPSILLVEKNYKRNAQIIATHFRARHREVCSFFEQLLYVYVPGRRTGM
jgi:hypothetical protein